MLIHNCNKTKVLCIVVECELATCTMAPLKYGPVLSCRNEFPGPVVISIRGQTKTFSVRGKRKHYFRIMYSKSLRFAKTPSPQTKKTHDDCVF